MLKEVRKTNWVILSNRPEWKNSNFAAYRIWKGYSEFGWFQRHEWEKSDGSIQMDKWISSTLGFPDNMHSVQLPLDESVEMVHIKNEETDRD